MEAETDRTTPQSNDKNHDLSNIVELNLKKTYEEIIDGSEQNVENPEMSLAEKVETEKTEETNSHKQATFSDFSKQKSQEIDEQINQEFAEDNESWKEIKEESEAAHEETAQETIQEAAEATVVIIPENTTKDEQAHEFDDLTNHNFISKPLQPVKMGKTSKKPFNLKGLILEKMQKYNGLKDQHLQGFFYSEKRKQILIKNGLITPDGYIINRPEEYLKKKDLYKKTVLIGDSTKENRKNSVKLNPYYHNEIPNKTGRPKLRNLTQSNKRDVFGKTNPNKPKEVLPEKEKTSSKNNSDTKLPILAHNLRNADRKSGSTIQSKTDVQKNKANSVVATSNGSLSQKIISANLIKSEKEVEQPNRVSKESVADKITSQGNVEDVEFETRVENRSEGLLPVEISN